MLESFKALIGDIYRLLVADTIEYFKEKYSSITSVTSNDAEILAIFIIHYYGNHEDFKDFLLVHKDRYDLPFYLCDRFQAEIKQWKIDYLKNKARLVDDSGPNSFYRRLFSATDSYLGHLALSLLAMESKFYFVAKSKIIKWIKIFNILKES